MEKTDQIKTQDLDATIARMRGWPNDGAQWYRSFDEDEFTPCVNDTDGCSCYLERPYSPTTDWRDAGPLLEEMVKDRRVEIFHGAAYVFCVLNPRTLNERMISAQGDTLAEAICRAWIKWKEAQGE